MSDLLSDRFLSNPEGLTVRQIKAHIAGWPDETPEGEPTRAMMILASDTAENGYLYVPVGEITEVSVEGESCHLMVLPQRSVGKLLHGAHHDDRGSA